MNTNRNIINLLKVSLVIIALAPILYLNQVHNVAYKTFVSGTGSWGLALILKMFFHQLVVVWMDNKKVNLFVVSATNGFISGFFELSAAAGIILLMKDKINFDIYAIMGFGLAIGSLESLILAFEPADKLLKGTSLEKSSEAIARMIAGKTGKKQLLYQFLAPLLERILCTFIHLSTRGLVFISILAITPYPFLLALLVFFIADGFLGYYFHISGKLLSGRGLATAYLYLLLLTIFSVGFFLLLTDSIKEVVF